MSSAVNFNFNSRIWEKICFGKKFHVCQCFDTAVCEFAYSLHTQGTMASRVCKPATLSRRGPDIEKKNKKTKMPFKGAKF